MNISDWPMQKIMSLPDHMFGRRFLISCQMIITGVHPLWDISEIAFPETAVIWEMRFGSCAEETIEVLMKFALGDQLPTTIAQFDRLEPIFNGLGVAGPGPRNNHILGTNNIEMRRLKMGVRTSGRRLVLQVLNLGATQAFTHVMLTVSGLPREIPD